MSQTQKKIAQLTLMTLANMATVLRQAPLKLMTLPR